jgi:hypothetical protein
MIDPAVSDAVEAGRVPEDVSAEYLSESKDMPAIIAIIVLTGITLIAVMGRALSRGILVGRFGFDDGLAVLGLVRFPCTSALTVTNMNPPVPPHCLLCSLRRADPHRLGPPL